MDKPTYENLWKWFDYSDRLQEAKNQINRIADEPIDDEDEDFETMLDVPGNLSFDLNMEILAFDPNSLFVDITIDNNARYIAESVFKQSTKDKIDAIELILKNLTFNVLKDYRQFIISYYKNKL